MNAKTTATTFGVDGEYLIVGDREYWAPLAMRVAMPVVYGDDDAIRWMQFRMAMVPFANDWVACLMWGNSDVCSNYHVWDLDRFEEHPATVELQIGEPDPDVDRFEPKIMLPRLAPQRAIAVLDAIARWERGVVGDLPD
jgi:hypothetical protein